VLFRSGAAALRRLPAYPLGNVLVWCADA